MVGAELVVYSSAVGPNNPELSYARELGLPTIRRAEMLAELMRLKHGIAVAGAHGKTTTTSMIALILLQAELDPTIIVGGRMDNIGGTNARMGMGKFLVTEADESDGSFNKLAPSIAVVTNMDRGAHGILPNHAQAQTILSFLSEQGSVLRIVCV
ncbi:MAG: Mur ligase domain-containing protein [Bdellovibrionota bacterium]